MNALTKVFIVLMTILSVVLVSLVVPFVANTDNYKEQVAAARAEAAYANANAALAQNALEVSRGELIAQFDGAQAELSAQRRLNDTLKASLAEVTGQLERSRADESRTKADIANLTAANSQFAKIQEDLQKELATRREETKNQSKSIIELGEANNNFANALAQRDRALRLTQENLVRAQEEIAELQATLAKIPQRERDAGTQPTGPVVSQPDVPINATVSDVRQAGDVTLVQLNTGSTGGAKTGMQFQVHREGQYQGTIVLMNVDEQTAVGRVRLLKNGGAIKVGDAARAGPAS